MDIRQTKTIGSILLDVELVTQEDIDQALEIQKQISKRLGEILVTLGVVSDDDIRWALAEQLNLPYVNIRKDQIDVEVAKLVPEKIARRYHVIPILKIDDELTVVVDDPLNKTVIKDIEKMTKSQIKISLGRTSDIITALDEIYGSPKDVSEKEQEPPPRFLSPWFNEADIQKILNDLSGQALLDRVLANALAHGVSRIYFQPGFEGCHISYRINGLLKDQVELGKEGYSMLLFRLKISAGLALKEVNHPQSREFSYWGHISGKEEPPLEKQVTIAVSIVPSAAGEAAVLNIINRPIEPMQTEEHEEVFPGFQERDLLEIRNVKAMLPHLKSGAVFLGGSPHPHKITTLYSLLQAIDPTKKQIMTLEAYTEYRTDKYSQMKYVQQKPWGITGGKLSANLESVDMRGASFQQPFDPDMVAPEAQEKISLERGGASSGYPLRFAGHVPTPEQRALSSWLSALQIQAPDVILVDRIGSDLVLSQCLDYASHTVILASLDFKNVFEILTYLLDCQIRPSVITSRVYALLAQQPIRVLCQECRQKDTTEFGQQIVARLHSVSGEAQKASPEIFAPGGCPACNMTGYAHYTVLFEVLKFDQWLKEMLLNNVPLADIQRAAVKRGFSSLEQKSITLLFTGKTSVEEVLSYVT